MLHTKTTGYKLTFLAPTPEAWWTWDTLLKKEALESLKKTNEALSADVQKAVKDFLDTLPKDTTKWTPDQKKHFSAIKDYVKATNDSNKAFLAERVKLFEETKAALGEHRDTVDKILGKGMSEEQNPEIADLKRLLIENGYLDKKYTDKKISFGNETIAGIKAFNKANPQNSLGDDMDKISVKRIKDILEVKTLVKALPVPKEEPKKLAPEVSNAPLASRVKRWEDGKLPETSKEAKTATERVQKTLITLWLYKWAQDGIYWTATVDAIKQFLKNTGYRGNLTADTNPEEITPTLLQQIESKAAIKSDIPQRREFPIPPKRPSATLLKRPPVVETKTSEADKLVKDLQAVDFFLDAYNRTYGERGNTISNKNGLVGIFEQVSNPDSERLAKEIWITDADLARLAPSLGIEVGSWNAKTREGLLRMVTIAVISALITGGASVALELFGINVSRSFEKGPHMQKILEAMWRRWDITVERRNVLMNPKTTSRDVEAVGQALRGRNLLPNNVRADVMKILSSDFFLFDFFADIFWNSEKEQMEVLIKQFQTARNLDEAEAILTQIVWIATNKYYEKYGSGKANNTLASLANSLKTIRELKAKNDKILGRKFDQRRYDRDTGRIQAILDATYGRPESVKWFPDSVTNIGQSYAPSLPKNLNPSVLWDVLQKMANTTIKGDKYSMLANLMRGVNFHTGISFKPDEFLEAFQNMRYLNAQEKKDFSRVILSNTGRQRNQNFNGLNLADGVAVMELNGQKVYFREKCTNVLTVINDIPTVIETARSIPVVIPISTGLPGWGGHGMGSESSTPGARGWETTNAGGNGMPNGTGFGR